ncbi:MAG: MFS transporter, partial [Sandaracinaceae bacterium]|nr:MFS transporter [Sandaracinaceae bacterium]
MRELSLGRLVALSAFGFSLPLLHGVLEPAVYGYKVLALAPGMHNAALGAVTFAGLSVAMITQPIVGLLSDRTRTVLGPRLPY